MSVEANRRLAQRYIDEVFTQGKVEVLDEIMAMPFLKQDLTGLVQSTHRGLDPFHCEIDDLIATEDRVVIRFTARGRHTGVVELPIGSFPPTGEEIAMEGVHILTVEDGKIVRLWRLEDIPALLAQLGAMPQFGGESG